MIPQSLTAVCRLARSQRITPAPEIQRLALMAATQYDVSLLQMSNSAPLLLVFLRHAGCTFCREAVADIAAQRKRIEAAGTRIAFVHMCCDTDSEDFFAKYGLAGIPRVSDPSRHIYRAFGLGRGGLVALFGPRVWWRGFHAGVLRGHGIGRLMGNGFQMPGVFLVRRGIIVRSFRHESSADRPDYVAFCRMP